MTQSVSAFHDSRTTCDSVRWRWRRRSRSSDDDGYGAVEDATSWFSVCSLMLRLVIWAQVWVGFELVSGYPGALNSLLEGSLCAQGCVEACAEVILKFISSPQRVADEVVQWLDADAAKQFWPLQNSFGRLRANDILLSYTVNLNSPISAILLSVWRQNVNEAKILQVSLLKRCCRLPSSSLAKTSLSKVNIFSISNLYCFLLVWSEEETGKYCNSECSFLCRINLQSQAHWITVFTRASYWFCRKLLLKVR